MKKKLLSLLALTFCLASSTWAEDVTISTPAQLTAFATRVNDGETTLNATLTQDIDLDGVTWTPIGNASNKYTGTFDGQGHAITNFSYTATGDNNGLFGFISGNAVVKNFSISGTLTSDGYTKNGVIGAATGTAKVIGIRSSLTINVSNSKAHSGGIVGGDDGATSTKIVVEGCEYSGTMTHSGAGDCQAGIMGYTGYSTIRNCIFSGEINGGNNNNKYGGILAYCKQPSFGGVQNCLSVGKIVAKSGCTTAAAIIANYNSSSTPANVKNNYYCLRDGSTTTLAIGGNYASSCEAPHAVNAAQLASGEVCVLLNGTDYGTNWYQTLSDDAYPTPYGTDKVYKHESYDCSMTPTTSVISYTNTPSINAHTYSDGICSNCGTTDPTYMTANSEGYYEIGNATQLKWFAAYVNAGHPAVKAKLTANIDLQDVAWTPIGNASVKYTGTFDGQGNAITNFSYTATSDYNGLFGFINDATVKNFSISGTLTSVGYTKNGVIGNANGTSKVSGIHSSLTINVSNKSAHSGGIVGGDDGDVSDVVLVEDCEYSGTMTHTGTGDCQAGILGYTGYGGVKNCIFSGEISGEDSKYGGILGYTRRNTFVGVQNCLSIGKIVANSGNTTVAAIIANYNGGVTENIKNNYYLLKDGSTTSIAIGNLATNCEAPVEVTTEQLASGEVCYALNGDQSNIAFYQAVGTDANPVLDSTHGQVYVNGTVCPDTGVPQGSVSYSNTEGTNVGSHVNVDGFCAYCGTLDENYMTAADGYYLIGTLAQFKWFAAYVNAGHHAVNAKLTANIDLDGVAWTPIGNADNKYTGTFDGGGFTISNFSYTTTADYTGFFGTISGGANIKNFTIEGTLTSNHGYVGAVIGQAGGGTINISDIHSKVNITCSKSRHGGILGFQNSTGTINIDRCTYSGKMTVNGNVTGNFGGIIGLTQNSASAIVNITNCLFDGEIDDGTGDNAGGIVGYANRTKVTIKNCLSKGTITADKPGQFFGQLNASNSKWDGKNYYVAGDVVGNLGSGVTLGGTVPETVTANQLASGEVAYNLGEAWYQTINTDTYPTLSSASEKVRYVGAAGYTTFYDATKAWALNGNAQAYIGTLNGSSSLHLTEIDDIPTGTAVVIGGTYYNKINATTTTGDATGNVLLGSDGTVTGGDGIYALAKKNDVVGFYPVAATVTIPAGKAYLNTSAGVKGFTFEFDDATAIEMVNGQSSMVNEIYNLAGQRLNKVQKGINIVNGRKILY